MGGLGGKTGGQVRGQPGRAPQKLAYLRECPRGQKNAMVGSHKNAHLLMGVNFSFMPFFQKAFT